MLYKRYDFCYLYADCLICVSDSRVEEKGFVEPFGGAGGNEYADFYSTGEFHLDLYIYFLIIW